MIQKNEKCCGCTACANICPVNAIKMCEDEEGFLYPHIDENKCIKCNLCEKNCPVIHPIKNENEIKSYAVRTKDKDILKSSTSGGFFTPIAKYVLENNGVVVGVGYGDDLSVKHLIVDNEKDIAALRGSKYVQSYLEDTFKKTKEILESGRILLFTGTPCQIQGLNKFLGKKYENLITIDLICKGVPSQKIWKKYLDYQEKKYNSKIKEIHFRNKTYGYHSSTMKIVFENGKVYYGSGRVDYMLKSYYSEICSRPSCYDCNFKSRKHISDFTIFDCWHAENLAEEIKDDDKGYTNIFVNTEKAINLLNEIKNELEIHEIDSEKAISLDGPMVEKSAIPHEHRKNFYVSLDKDGLEKTIKKYLNVSATDKLIEKSKKVLYKTKILKMIRRK